jgi:hypothetical protein
MPSLETNHPNFDTADQGPSTCGLGEEERSGDFWRNVSC